MKVWFDGDIESLKRGIEVFSEELMYQISPGEISVHVEHRPGNIEVIFEKGKGIIRYQEKVHFFRALGLLFQEMKKRQSFSIIEEPQFDMNGIMVDVSRNAVLRVDSIKTILKKMAIMGLNMLMLYTEDTYAVPNWPYFGYMRGRYSYEELKECDDYADMLGIEIIPCIQTLGHLEQVIKWDFTNGFMDTSDIILAGCDKTYEFIEDIIKAASAPFRSKKIHLGMDEAHNIGLGRYLDINGYSRRFDIMNNHLAKVKKITDKYGLEPMIWSDMYFRLGSKTGDYYDVDAAVPEDIVNSIPENVGLVYWDYYHNKEDEYRTYISKHKNFNREVIFAGGVWTWNGIIINYGKTFTTTNAALSACKKEGIKKVFATMWGDNGAETNVFSGLLGMQLFAEHGYSKELDEDKLKSRFEFCTGGKYDTFLGLSSLDRIPGEDYDIANPSKYLLWQDVLIGLFDKHVEGKPIGEYYAKLEAKFKKLADEAGQWRFVFDVPYKLCRVLSLKCDIGLEIKKRYDSRDMNALKVLARDKLKELHKRINDLRIAHRNQWLKTYKPFGWEILDIRYGGLLSRVETASERLEDFISGKIDVIEELEEERLYFDFWGMGNSSQLKSCNIYSRIISACPIG
ncbi:MAG TPA: beta-N-acetylhexosaminidase [Clostridiaceae bacterium]|nr:beta-N-acetylhexosaminidase [Clostridiaceae bacterium]